MNSILILGDCVGERLTMGVVWVLQIITTLVFAAKYCYSLFLQKNDSLGAFYSVLVIDWDYYSFLNVKRVAYEEDYGLEFCERTCSKV